MQITTFLRTRVARRILGLFVLSSVLPLAALAALAHREVSQRLKDERMGGLEVEARQAGAAVFDRLQMIDLQLQLLQRSMAAPASGGIQQLLATTPGDSFAFSALAVQDGANLRSLLGDLPDPGPLDQTGLDHLRRGRPLVLVAQTSAGPGVLIGRQIDKDTTILWAMPSEAVLWGFDRRTREDAEGRRLCVIEMETRQVLHCSYNGHSGGGASLEAVRPLFLGYEFGAGTWSIVASASQEGYLAALARFRWTFGLVVLITFALAFWLSNVLIRRSMLPLEQLQDGTRRLAAGDFHERVLLTSGDEFEDLADSFNSMAASLDQQFSTLRAINAFDRAVLSVPQLLPVTESVLQEATALFGASWVLIGFARSGQPGRWRLATAGVAGSQAAVRDVDLEPSEASALLTDSTSLLGAPDRAHHPLLGGKVTVPGDIRLVQTFRVDLGARGLGFLAFGFPPGGSPANRDELDRLRTLVDQVALGLSSVHLIEELDSMSWGAITALARAIDAKSPWTAGHSERVTDYAMSIAEHLDLTEQERLDLHRGGLLHDVGKIGVSSSILNKPAKLTPEEMETMRQHPVIGARILTPIEAFRSALPVVLHHHEAWDGGGYPEGLAADDIPRLARILAVADVFDALTSDRPYRAGWPAAEAEAYVIERGGKMFDPEAVVAFRRWRNDIRLVLRESPVPEPRRREIA